MRQIALDTETTGLDPSQGHRIIEIGCVELLNRRPTGNRFHYYLQPDRQIDPGAIAVHGITSEFLADKPRFGDIVQSFLDFIREAEVIIHNASFDVGFLDYELSLLGRPHGQTQDYCRVLDTLEMARRRFPGQRNALDALCKRYNIDNSQRTLHGALLDAQILADVYLAMTGGQADLSLEADPAQRQQAKADLRKSLPGERPPLRVLRATAEERAAHERYLDLLDKSSGGQCLWRRLEAES